MKTSALSATYVGSTFAVFAGLLALSRAFMDKNIGSYEELMRWMLATIGLYFIGKGISIIGTALLNSDQK